MGWTGLPLPTLDVAPTYFWTLILQLRSAPRRHPTADSRGQLPHQSSRCECERVLRSRRVFRTTIHARFGVPVARIGLFHQAGTASWYHKLVPQACPCLPIVIRVLIHCPSFALQLISSRARVPPYFIIIIFTTPPLQRHPLFVHHFTFETPTFLFLPLHL
jgi:hypothetical protein